MREQRYRPERVLGFSAGRGLENSCLGRLERGAEYEAAEKQLERDKRGEIADPEALYDLVKHFQPGGDPTNPDRQFATDLRVALIDQLNLPEERWNDVGFFTAVDTVLDREFGVDAFLELQDAESGKVYRATLDLTQQADKLASGHKADAVIGEPPDVQESEDAYLAFVDQAARPLARRIHQELELDLSQWQRDSYTDLEQAA